ncbi:bifunctional tRNA (5-methylaminomethyl-2-thiouridine)(34)-methyltransferase MnmD/FAD-dependent 5-carboxymethylaminomethyl-2-thiouridine(34) oxidoreductase MnmC [Oceanicaulis sp. LC35]|uniref:bifunctional tRNA (5-methylaminomethyl-2-thiouridine)(34)-methyltransferase MnmD/FAD-dependent 5-carboxymethylaminomethyl-2-thiouridine(34) oxidoreductase MnmC n=1 Tax=Oceanicaulis sp. LC35 TaxID=3349635 RepID=UPI003F83718A
MSENLDPYALKRPHARIDWTETGPVAVDAGDVYFSAEDGLAETRSVFLQAANFPDRFAKGRSTVVAELGFGTGLNFLALWDLFVKTAPSDARLHFVSIEGFPLHKADAERALSAFPELAALSAQLTEVWPSPHKGPHRRVFENGRVMLTVFHDLAETALPNMAFKADAWFLDGFAPAKNPDMWDTDVFAELARLSAPGAPAVTFTVAGAVRRGLAAAGFSVEKKPGFGRKRERLEAIFKGAEHVAEPTPFPSAQPTDGPIAIIGGGIAAASLVHALALRGRSVDVFAEGGWAAGASGAPRGLLTPRLELGDRPHNRALLAAFDYARTLYRDLVGFEPTGVVRLAADTKGAERLVQLADALDDSFSFLDPVEAADRCGLGGEAGALWMSNAAQIRPEALVPALAGGAACQDVRIDRLEQVEGGWRLQGAGGGVFGPYAGVVLAGGWEQHALLSEHGLSLEPTAGQVGLFDSTFDLRAPANWGGYAARLDDLMLIGATHEKSADPGAIEDAEEALRTLAEAAPGGPIPLGERQGSWSGVRAAVADRLPLVGALPPAGFETVWRSHAKGGPAPHDAPLAPSGLFVLGGFGARGFAHAPLLAEALVSALCDEPAPLERAALASLHPARFAWRALRRG